MAAPFVSGMAALYKEAYPDLNSTEILSHMKGSALDLGEKGKDNLYGYGLIQPPPSLEDNIFPDVPENSWYKKDVNNLYIKGIINGYGDGKFYPYQPITRAEAVTMIGKALKLSGEKSETIFLDVPVKHFASGYINSTTNKKIIVGFQDHTFRPSDRIIRGDVAVILQGAFKLPNSNEMFFSDVDPGKHYFNAINSLAAQNIFKGFSDGTFKPDENITRAQFSVFLSNSMK